MPESSTSTQPVRVGVVQSTYVAEVPPDCELASARSGVSRNVDHLCDLIVRAGTLGVRLALTPEDVTGMAHCLDHSRDDSLVRELVRASCEPTLAAMQKAAREAGVWLAACLPIFEDDCLVNTTFLISDRGQIVGRYRKTHIPPGEERRFSAGKEYPIFQTPFGRVGVLTCWDMMFPEPARILMLAGADLILHPTLGYDFGGEMMGEMRFRVRAFDNAVYIAVAMPASQKGDRPGRSCIVSPQGHVLADAGYRPDAIVCADLDLG